MHGGASGERSPGAGPGGKQPATVAVVRGCRWALVVLALGGGATLHRPRRRGGGRLARQSIGPHRSKLGTDGSNILEAMANQQPPPEWPLRVEVQPAPGWVRIPHDPRPQGRFLKYDPCARVAQQLIRAGQVNKLMLRSTTEFLRRMSLDNLTNLWLGTFIEAPSPEAMLISTMVVLPPVKTPMLPDKDEVDYEELRRRAATKKVQGESDHDVQLVELPWGRGFRSLVASAPRSRSDGRGHDEHRVPDQIPCHAKHDLRSRTGPSDCRRPNRAVDRRHRPHGQHDHRLRRSVGLAAEEAAADLSGRGPEGIGSAARLSATASIRNGRGGSGPTTSTLRRALSCLTCPQWKGWTAPSASTAPAPSDPTRHTRRDQL